MARPGNELGIIIFPHYKEGIMEKETTLKEIAKEVSTVREIIEEVKTEICDKYCKWPKKWDKEAEGCELIGSSLCLKYLLRRLG